MIAETLNICVKKFHIPNLRPLRALFLVFLFFIFTGTATAQSFNVDTLINQLDTGHFNDSTRIHMMHRISYLLSETDVNRSFAYYERVSRQSDSLHFTFGKALAN